MSIKYYKIQEYGFLSPIMSISDDSIMIGPHDSFYLGIEPEFISESEMKHMIHVNTTVSEVREIDHSSIYVKGPVKFIMSQNPIGVPGMDMEKFIGKPRYMSGTEIMLSNIMYNLFSKDRIKNVFTIKRFINGIHAVHYGNCLHMVIGHDKPVFLESSKYTMPDMVKTLDFMDKFFFECNNVYVDNISGGFSEVFLINPNINMRMGIDLILGMVNILKYDCIKPWNYVPSYRMEKLSSEIKGIRDRLIYNCYEQDR